MQRLYVDFSVFAPSGSAGVVAGYVEFFAVPRVGELVSFMAPKEGVLPIAVPGFTWQVKVEQVIHAANATDAVSLSLATVVLLHEEHVLPFAQFMEQGFGLGFTAT